MIFINIIKIVLKIKSPSNDADELDFTEKTDDILESVNIFNDKFRDWSKRIIITNLSKRAMHLLMVIERANIAENLSVKEIRSFIQYLRNNKGWSAYSREENKMFETVEFYRVDSDMANTILERVKSDSILYKNQKEDIDFMKEAGAFTGADFASGADMDDADIITVIKYLIKTKNKGLKAHEKAEDIETIKKVIQKWL